MRIQIGQFKPLFRVRFGLVICLVGPTAASAVSAQTDSVPGKPHFELRGEHFGDAQPKPKFFGSVHCQESKSVPGDAFCYASSNDPIAGVGVSDIHSYMDGKLYGVMLSFGSDNYSKIVDVFTAKYGSPDTTYTEAVHTAMNAQYLNEIARWSFFDGDMDIKKYSDTIDKGEVSATSFAGLAEFAKRSKSGAEAAAARDLGPPVKH
jgi:hypothetical protein